MNKMSFDSTMLRKAIKEKKGTPNWYTKNRVFPYAPWYRRISGEVDFSLTEVQFLIRDLELTREEIKLIFYI